jgi:hypothetical protein
MDLRAISCAGISVVVLIASLLSAPALFADPPQRPVSVDTNRRTFVLGDLVQIILDNRSGEKVFLPGCQSYQVERFGEQRYEALDGEHCIAEGDARGVAPGETTLQFQTRPEHMDSPLRVVVVYGIGCAGERPLSQARCRDFATIYSPSFRVREPVVEK